MQHALIVVGNNVGNSRKADVFSTFFVKIRLPLAIKVGSGAIGRKPFQPRESLLDLMAITLWRGGRAVEGARLESVCRFYPYRGFESLPLRHHYRGGKLARVRKAENNGC